MSDDTVRVYPQLRHDGNKPKFASHNASIDEGLKVNKQQPEPAQQEQAQPEEPQEDEKDRSFMGMLYRNRLTIVAVLVVLVILVVVYMFVSKSPAEPAATGRQLPAASGGAVVPTARQPQQQTVEQQQQQLAQQQLAQQQAQQQQQLAQQQAQQQQAQQVQENDHHDVVANANMDEIDSIINDSEIATTQEEPVDVGSFTEAVQSNIEEVDDTRSLPTTPELPVDLSEYGDDSDASTSIDDDIQLLSSVDGMSSAEKFQTVKCGEKLRSGRPCRNAVMKGKERCRMHLADE